MTAKELIIQLMTENDIRNRDLAPTLGISPSALTDRLKKKPKENMTLQTLSELLYGISILMEGHTTYTVKVVGSDGSEYVLDGYEPSHPIMKRSSPAELYEAGEINLETAIKLGYKPSAEDLDKLI